MKLTTTTWDRIVFRRLSGGVYGFGDTRYHFILCPCCERCFIYCSFKEGQSDGWMLHMKTTQAAHCKARASVIDLASLQKDEATTAAVTREFLERLPTGFIDKCFKHSFDARAEMGTPVERADLCKHCGATLFAEESRRGIC